ncbi:hypothetical protein HE1_00436 [Holospora elegans E1]|uniref:DUF4167 domain-containing protein n=1 Tax=Holospora elegans E1 TaxID=1427503 RepID=A0A023DXI4_9PROT|nr:DUF4167 domain-containing protein [Holospora elegans]GAJ46113.1 hypothetical protein HE1_00436 [Holospora elegans E1]
MNSFRDKPQGPYQFRPGSHRNQKVAKNKHHIFESQGPTGKARGTSVQLVEKYLSLGREALALGDTVLSEYFFEYVEHYQRVSHDLNSLKQEESPSVQSQSEEEKKMILKKAGTQKIERKNLLVIIESNLFKIRVFTVQFKWLEKNVESSMMECSVSNLMC